MGQTITWGVEASPYLLKLEACLRFKQVPFRRLPRDGSRFENLQTYLRLQRAIRNHRVKRHPHMDQQLDEYPSVPFFSAEKSQFHYDSSAIADWLDLQVSPTPVLTPSEPARHFCCAPVGRGL